MKNCDRAVVYILIVLTLIFLIPTLSLADGLPIKDGRYFGGPSILIEISEAQKQLIKTTYEPFFNFPLTSEQREFIRRETTVEPPPSKLMLVKIPDTVGECTCGVANLGLLIDPSHVEIPVAYICTDEKAEKIKITN